MWLAARLAIAVSFNKLYCFLKVLISGLCIFLIFASHDFNFAILIACLVIFMDPNMVDFVSCRVR